ncbi:MAG: preprotein translocase subunit SecG [Candidatus Omnitrophica bacterium]|nr:preprotein translocase subunit SecG [Candidatus Omnitrophota bacterium]
MTGFIIFLHTIISISLVTVILMQSGRGGGLTEAFSSAESMFGAKTNEFMVRATAVLATLFIVTCLSLAFLSSRKDKSIMPSQIASQTESSQIEGAVKDAVKETTAATGQAVQEIQKAAESAPQNP